MPGDSFYHSPKWRAIRQSAITRDAWTCQSCGAGVRGKRMSESSPYVDHIKNRRDRPDLALSLSNLQTLCAGCHNRKTIFQDDPKRCRPAIGVDGFPVE